MENVRKPEKKEKPSTTEQAAALFRQLGKEDRKRIIFLLRSLSSKTE